VTRRTCPGSANPNGPCPRWRFLAGLQGSVSDVTVYDYALTDAQAADLWAGSTASCPLPPSPPPSPPRPPPAAPGTATPPPLSPPLPPAGAVLTFALCMEGYGAATFNGNVSAQSQLSQATTSFLLAYSNAAVQSVGMQSAVDGCAQPVSRRALHGCRRLLVAPTPGAQVVALSLSVAAPTQSVVTSASTAFRALATPASSAAAMLLLQLRLFGLSAVTNVWLQPVAGITGVPPPVAAAAPPPPRPPPRPPFPPAAPAPPGAMGGFGGSKNRLRLMDEAARSAGAAVGYAVAAVVAAGAHVLPRRNRGARAAHERHVRCGAALRGGSCARRQRRARLAGRPHGIAAPQHAWRD
jgi:hypothetical protein